MTRPSVPSHLIRGRRPVAGGLAAVLCLALLLGACSARPFEVPPPTAAAASLGIDPETRTRRGAHDYNPDPRPIALCYSSQLNNQEEVIARAQELCPNGGTLAYFGEDALFNDCALFQPNRVTFICTPGPPPPSPFK